MVVPPPSGRAGVTYVLRLMTVDDRGAERGADRARPPERPPLRPRDSRVLLLSRVETWRSVLVVAAVAGAGKAVATLPKINDAATTEAVACFIVSSKRGTVKAEAFDRHNRTVRQNLVVVVVMVADLIIMYFLFSSFKLCVVPCCLSVVNDCVFVVIEGRCEQR